MAFIYKGKDKNLRALADRTSNRSSSTRTTSTSSKKTSRPVSSSGGSGAKKITPVTPTTGRQLSAGINVDNLSEANKKRLRDKGYIIPTTSNKKTAVETAQIAANRLSPEGQANVNKLVSNYQNSLGKASSGLGINPLTGLRGVGGGFGGGGGGSWGPAPSADEALAQAKGGRAQPQFEFSVTPGAKAGPVDLGVQDPLDNLNYGGPYNTPSGRTEEERQAAREAAQANKEILINTATIAPVTGLGVTAVGRLTPKMVQFLSKTKAGKKLLDAYKARKAGQVGKAGTAPKPTSPLRQPVTQAFRNAPVGTAISGLGALAIGAGIGSSIGSYTGETGGEMGGASAGTVRNATPSTNGAGGTAPTTPTDTTGSTATPANTKQSSVTQSTSSSFAPQSLSAPASYSSPVSGGAGGGTTSVGGAVGSGTGYSPTPVGENGQELGDAGSRALALQRAQAQQATGTVPIGDQVDLGNLEQLRQRARDLLDQHGAEAVTMPEFKANVQAMLAAGIENLKKIQPTPPEPVVDTQEQADFLNAQDPTQQQSMRSFMDDTRRALGMPDMERQRVDVMQQLQVVQETYQRVIDDIKTNPNLPKGLASRRLTEVFEDQKFAANALLAQLQMIDTQLSDANARLNQEMGIYEYEQNQNEKERQRRIDQFGYLVDSGAVAGLSDKEIRQWAAITGIPEDAIRAAKDAKNTTEKDYDVKWENDEFGNTYQVIYDKNDPLAEPIVRNVGQLSRNYSKPAGGTSATPKEQKIYSSKDIPGDVRASLISDLQDPTFVKDFGDDQNKAVAQLSVMYPEVNKATLEEFYNSYIGEPAAEPEADKKWWQFWK